MMQMNFLSFIYDETHNNPQLSTWFNGAAHAVNKNENIIFLSHRTSMFKLSGYWRRTKNILRTQTKQDKNNTHKTTQRASIQIKSYVETFEKLRIVYYCNHVDSLRLALEEVIYGWIWRPTFVSHKYSILRLEFFLFFMKNSMATAHWNN